MDYLAYINQMVNQSHRPAHFLVSGDDSYLRQSFFNDIIQQSLRQRRLIIIIDDTRDRRFVSTDVIQRHGGVIEDGLSGRYALYDHFDFGTINRLSQSRELLHMFDFDEKKIQEVIAYLDWIKTIESLRQQHRPLNLDVLGEYSSSLLCDMRLTRLYNQNVISREEMSHLLGKYEEVAGAGADLEHALYLLEPLTRGDNLFAQTDTIVRFALGSLGHDLTYKQLILKLLSHGIDHIDDSRISIILMTNGLDDKEYLIYFLKDLSDNTTVHLLAKDVFTLQNTALRQSLMNRFNVKIYGRHESKLSCEMIEQECGDVDITNSSYTVTYDRHWRSNRPVDILFNRNKTETYTQNARTREPKYRKEEIARLMEGEGIIDCLGQTTYFSLRY